MYSKKVSQQKDLNAARNFPAIIDVSDAFAVGKTDLFVFFSSDKKFHRQGDVSRNA